MKLPDMSSLTFKTESRCHGVPARNRLSALSASPLRLCVSVSLFLALSLAMAMPVYAQDAAAPEDLAGKSLPLRTALHHDPTMESPLTGLVAMYRKANRLEELQGMYQTHLEQWPNDASATVVLIRIQTEASDPAALRTAQAAAQRFPQIGYVHYLLFGLLQADRDPAAIAALDRAIELETDPARKAAWIDTLLPLARLADRRDLIQKHLEDLVKLQSTTPEGALAAARKADDLGEHQLALDTVNKALEGSTGPETMVDLELTAAEALAALGEADAAGERLDALLGKLTSDYWRRGDILRRRLALVQNETQRETMIAAARDRVAARQGDEAAVLDLANLLESFERRREAVDVLREASRDLPDSVEIERATLSLYDALRDEPGRAEYLRARLDQRPNRVDLAVLLGESLYLDSRAEEAESLLKEKLAVLERDDRTAVQLELARRLRRSMLPTEASRLFGEVVEASPERLEVMRELAELYVALGERRRAQLLLSQPLPQEAALENFLDLAHFMVEGGFRREARVAIEARRETDPTNMDLPMLMLEVDAAEARQGTGQRVIDESRPLADTAARYRIWLEGAAKFYGELENRSREVDDKLARFLSTERDRLREEARAMEGDARWAEAAVDRRLVFADVAVNADQAVLAAELLQAGLAEDPPLEPRLRMRRGLIAALDKSKGGEEAMEAQLTALASETPGASDEANARLAVLYHDAGQPAETERALKAVDLNLVNDPAVLSNLERVYTERSDREGVEMAIRRLTQTDPTNRENWSRHVTLLALKGDEDALRTTLRRLLAGVDRMPVTDEVRDVLEAHLLESYWRSVSAKLASLNTLAAEGGNPDAELGEMLYLLDSATRVAESDRGALWAVWTRAYVLNRLGREAERDEAIAELERLAQAVRASERPAPDADMAMAAATQPATQPTDAEGDAGDAGEMIATATQPAEGEAEEVDEAELMVPFPDGLYVSMSTAREVLTADPRDRVEMPLRDATGPMPADGRLDVAWAYESVGGDPIVAIFPLKAFENNRADAPGVHPAPPVAADAPAEAAPPDSEGTVLVVGASGAVSSVDLRSGKLLWRQPDAAPRSDPGPGSTTQQLHPSGNYYMEVTVPGLVVQPVLDDAGRLWLASDGSVTCLDAASGSVLWKATFEPGGEAGGPTAVEVVGERGLVYQPGSGRLRVLDAATGKLLREMSLGGGGMPSDEGQQATLSWRNTGMASDAGRTLVYGSSAAVIDTDTGRLRWSFSPGAGSIFPVKLEEPGEEGDPKKTPAAAGAGGGGGGRIAAVSSRSMYHSTSSLYIGPGYGGYGGYGGMTSPLSTPITRVHTTGRNGVESIDLSLLRGNRVQIVPPAAAWADASSPDRLGLLHGPRLLLLASPPTPPIDAPPNHDIGAAIGYLTRLDLPVAGQGVSVHGTLLGVSGRHAVFLTGTGLQKLDLNTGQTTPIDTAPATGQPDPGTGHHALTGTLDGPVAYIAGDSGVMCINLALGTPIYTAPWPDAIAQRLQAQPAQANYTYRSITLTAIDPADPTQALSNTTAGADLVAAYTGPATTRPPIDRVVPGLLLTSPRPDLLIALTAAVSR